MLDPNAKWFYFGCVDQPGHYLFDENMYKIWGEEYTKFGKLDGLLPPQKNKEAYIASFSQLSGWGISALAFWDYSVDDRGGSNSVFFVESLTITREEMFEEVHRRFPSIIKRLPRTLSYVSE